MTDPVDLLKGLADRTRLRIMGLLAAAEEELCVCQIVAALGESQYKISRHLKILKNSGWIKERRDGRWVHYMLIPDEDLFHGHLKQTLFALPYDFLDLKVKIKDLPRIKKSTGKEK